MSYNMGFSQEMNDKAKEAGVKFLYRQGHEILDRDGRFDVITQDEDGCIIFTDIFLQNSMDESPLSRTRIEKDMLRELVDHIEWTDCCIRYDTIIVRPLGNRALLKHHINAVGQANCEDD